jgi:hypothetical protein
MNFTKALSPIRYRYNSATKMISILFTYMLAIASLTTLANASNPNQAPPGGNYTSIAAAPFGGFWVQVDSNQFTGTYAIDGAPAFESVPERGSIAAIPASAATNEGYWVVAGDAGIYARGSAPALCDGSLVNCSGFYPISGRHITAAAARANGKGLWAVDNFGAVWTAGDAPALGDVTEDPHTPTGIVGTPSGNGYYILLADGGVHSFGDAVFYGSTGGNRPGGHDLTGIALSRDVFGRVNGYWLVASDGGVFTYGDAPFLGSSGGAPGRGAISNIVTRRDGRSYAWVHRDGQVSLSQTIPGVVITSAKWSNTVLDVQNENGEAGVPLVLAPPNSSNSQLWDLWPTQPQGNVVQLVNVQSGLCMDNEGESPIGKIILWPCKGAGPGQGNQLFRLVTNASGHTQFQSLLHDSWLFGEYSASGSTIGLIYSEDITDPLTVSWTVKLP